MVDNRGWRNADLAFVNGRVITVNRRDEIAEGVAVVGNRIARVGSNESIRELVGNGTRVVDLHGRTLTPGFMENHIHIPNAAENRNWVDCSPEAVSSIDEIAATVAKRVAEKPPGEWNEYQITFDEGNLTLLVNGEKLNEADHCEVIPGKIGLQSEGGEIHFRKVKLTPIDK